MLSPALRDHRGNCLSVLEERAIRKLLAPISGNQFLNQHFTRTAMSNGQFEKLPQLLAAVRSPSLSLRFVEKMLFDGGFQYVRRIKIDLLQFFDRPRMATPRSRNVQFHREVVQIPLIPGELYRIPFRGGNPEELPQFTSSL